MRVNKVKITNWQVDTEPRPHTGVVVKWITCTQAAIRYMETRPDNASELEHLRKHLDFLNWLLVD